MKKNKYNKKTKLVRSKTVENPINRKGMTTHGNTNSDAIKCSATPTNRFFLQTFFPENINIFNIFSPNNKKMIN